MIGNFTYLESPRLDQVAVDIGCTLDGRRVGQIKLAPHWRHRIEETPDFPGVGQMPIEAAVCYGVFLAMKLSLSLVVTGDPSAWDPAWGRLVERTEIVPWLENRFR